MCSISGVSLSSGWSCAASSHGRTERMPRGSLEPIAWPQRPRPRRGTMFEWLITAAGVILIVFAILAYFDAADVVIDLFTSLLQLAVAAVALTFTLLAALLNALKRLLNKQHNGIIP